MNNVNWESKLTGHEIVNKTEDGKTIRVVLLAGLQRLAREAGITKSHCEFNFISAAQTSKDGIMQCIYTAEFKDGTSWCGAADCNSKNTTGVFLNYPTAVAESRAEARCLRKALGISMLSAEELGFQTSLEVTPDQTIDSQVIKAIETLCQIRNISVAEVLDAVLIKSRAQSVFALQELTVEEGQHILAWLNEQKPKAKNKTDERTERKKALMAKREPS
jgi:hypothetical protein